MDSPARGGAGPRRLTRYLYQNEIAQMMFVFGETGNLSGETTMLVEDIVHAQVIELIIQAAGQSGRRGSRSISYEDILFIIRHDRVKVARLRNFLSWKDVRKNVKDNQGGGADPNEELVEEADVGKYEIHPSKARKKQPKLPWTPLSQYMDVLGERDDGDEEDEDEVEAYKESLARLKVADDITRNMTREEYARWSECRQASFTFKKARRFRDWASMSALMDTKPNDDVIECLGYLTFEMVRKLTEWGMAIRREAEAEEKAGGGGNIPSRAGIFARPREDYGALRMQDVEEAYRRMQLVRRPGWNFRGGLSRTRLSLI
ncbi:transcription initiation factor IID, 18kD subunit-domain-containing protein [Piptocephalis cylindrospora]|uniref:Transcription initiation factor IID, 18kD subunit-domain-containing protein n=1 Tax=Piptocephalis cylindrospora TaxID=1907219 RepID=A0A4P9Y2Z1_9FUNG|nr:transcription initiation factor IID, 18kD subunit-domain-containing protein [Piptocephalis cylindrospora]|eukprot:RKP13288.1 transcription initiation factor IID, 18kD subunit-domain-containing protein [Piptocephalis cylindrospora]